jgi:hypothetical protein
LAVASLHHVLVTSLEKLGRNMQPHHGWQNLDCLHLHEISSSWGKFPFLDVHYAWLKSCQDL